MSFYINVLDRIKNEKNFHTDSQLAEFLGVKKQDIYNWKTRKSFDVDEVIGKCKSGGIDIDFILTGNKKKYKQ